MRPLRLTMNAFGPYKGKVDFTARRVNYFVDQENFTYFSFVKPHFFT